MRDGKLIETRDAKDFDRTTLISMMVNRDISSNMYPAKNCDIGEDMMEVRKLSSASFKDVSFSVRRGEILGVAGLMGAGRTELVESIFGLRKIDSGEIFINGAKVEITHPKDAIRHKVALIPEDRKGMGLNLITSVRENLTLPTLSQYLRAALFISERLQNAAAQSQVSVLNIKTPSLFQEVRNLSGGNQQKIVMGKWLLTDADIIMLDEPTRGIDVGAKHEIYTLICKLAEAGKAVIMISSELPEVLGLSDRVLVMHEGRKKAMLGRGEMSQKRIMHYATLGDVEYGAAVT
jgi:inositol transport system ATP-binding protein